VQANKWLIKGTGKPDVRKRMSESKGIEAVKESELKRNNLKG
jgi:hypothetical protein